MNVLFQILLVALGSACGGLARWGVAITAGRLLGSSLPFGTFFVNITGSFFLGWFLTVLANRFEHAWLRPDDLRLLVGVGFTGAYTTFSTFGWESYGMVREGDGWLGVAYMGASVVLGLFAVHLGVVAARFAGGH